jgi:hypothetical protein
MAELDLHGFHPNTLTATGLVQSLIRQAWEMGEDRLTFIHGHGHGRGKPVPHSFVNTNTGYLGLTVRRILRNDLSLRRWMFVKFGTSDPGFTTIRLRPNHAPSRTAWDPLPEHDYDR